MTNKDLSNFSGVSAGTDQSESGKLLPERADHNGFDYGSAVGSPRKQLMRRGHNYHHTPDV